MLCRIKQKVIEHSNIYKSNLPIIEQENSQESNKESPKDFCITQRAAGHDVEFLILKRSSENRRSSGAYMVFITSTVKPNRLYLSYSVTCNSSLQSYAVMQDKSKRMGKNI